MLAHPTGSALGPAAEWICFSTDEPGELDAVRPCFRGVDKIAGMAKGRFIAHSRDRGEELTGRVV